MIRSSNTLLTEMAVPSKIFSFSDLSTIWDIVEPFINTWMISRWKLLSNRIILQYENSSINFTGRIWRKRQRSFVQGNVVRKGVTAQTRRLHNRQRYRDNDIQLDDFLRGVGRNISVFMPGAGMRLIVTRLNWEWSWIFLPAGVTESWNYFVFDRGLIQILTATIIQHDYWVITLIRNEFRPLSCFTFDV